MSRSIVVRFKDALSVTTGQGWDAVVVGAGHNGLTAAAYLGRAGLRTLVLERREVVGGCCVTEEIHPGCRASTTSYIASMLRPEVIRDLALSDHGLRMAYASALGKLQVTAATGPILGFLHATEGKSSRIESAHRAACAAWSVAGAATVPRSARATQLPSARRSVTTCRAGARYWNDWPKSPWKTPDM